jgi:hypothetical protein
VDDEVAVSVEIGELARQRKVDAQPGGDLGPRRVEVDEGDPHGREAREQAGDTAPDHAGPDDGHAVTDEWRGVPEGVDRRLDRAGEHGTARRQVVRHDGHGLDRHDVGRLMRVQAEDRAPDQGGRPLLDDADAEVAVLDRSREVAVLVWGSHHGVLVRGDRSAEDDRLGAPAHA